MKFDINDLDKPHFIGRKRLKICSLKKTVLICLCVIVLILAATLSWFFLISPISVKFDKSDLYVLVLDETVSASEAQTSSLKVAKSGGSGYIINDGKFRITAAVYKKKSDAQTVMERLRTDYPFATVENYSIKKQKIKSLKRGGVDKKIKKIIEYPIELIEFLLGKSIAIDTLNDTESAVLLKLNSRLEDSVKNKNALEALLRDFPTSKSLAGAHELYLNIIEQFNYITDLDHENTFSHRIKYLSCSLTYLYHNFRLAI